MANQTISMSQDQRQIQTLAPQLRQSLELLQLPVLELRAMVQQELQNNPTLEEHLPDTPSIEIEQGGAAIDDNKELSFKEEFEILARMDDEWCEYFMQEQEFQGKPQDSEAYERKRDFLLNSAGETLQEHLRRQMSVAALDEHDRQLGELLIGTINEDGYLTQDLESLALSADADTSRLQDVLHLIQDFNPVGVGARDMKECLLLQLERLGHAEQTANAIVENHLELLGSQNYREISHILDCPVAEIHAAARLIATLNPKPGRAFNPDITQYITPDIVVEKTDEKYTVVLTNEQLPHLRISRQYRQLMRQADTSPEVRDYIRDRIRSGMFLIKSITQRQQTIYRVAVEIVRVQTGFLDHGISHLKPLVMADVARRVKLHETTVSRCVANKYMQTPQGIFEMKYFFTPGLKTADGAVISNKTVQDMLRTMVAEEDPTHPVSDQEIQEHLEEVGIKVARRTVAKYRLALKIPPSHLRKAPG